MKKPTISRRFPPDKQTWEAVVELLEILTGRRKNKLDAVALTPLSFSNPPTQAEVQALYQYTNRVQAGLAAIAGRLDD